MMWIVLWRAFKLWWFGEEPCVALGSLAVQLSEWAQTEAGKDWFAWECEQYAKCPTAFWFDHWRYRGSKFAYPEPTEPQRRANWDASLKRMIAEYGEAEMKMIGNAVVAIIAQDPQLEDVYWHAPAPWEWAVATYQSKALH